MSESAAFAPVNVAMVHAPFCTKPEVVRTCACGTNIRCRTCGYGSGAYPCKCTPKVVMRNV